ncbi:hypothetical protein KY348_07585 [Candidatus Woesearchaeota archaeon]|nr:hypothetical protein [Candidatus Woesearchaeota archaeon]
MATKKRDLKKSSLIERLSKIKIRVEDLLLVVVGVLVLMIIVTIGHYSLPGETSPFKGAKGLSFLFVIASFIRTTTYRYVFFLLVPLLVVWIAKLFQKKTWNIKKSLIWLGIGIIVMLLIYFSIPTQTGLEKIPASENPDVKMFVMSFCPFGQQAENSLKPVQDLFGDKVIIEPHFIINDLSDREVQRSGCLKNNTLCTLHGVNELNENMRQMCIWKYYQEKWWDYVMCINDNCDQYNVETCWNECAENNEISVAKIRACQELEGISLAEKDRDLSDELKAYSSPTLIINNVAYGGTERTPEMLKKAICKGFKNPPPECKIKLGSDAEIAASSKEKPKESIVIREETSDKCTEEGVCPSTGEKAVPVNSS